MGPLGSHPRSGTRLGSYTLGEHVGSGATASVFRAVDDTGQIFALKVLNPAQVLEEDLRRFTREYEALSRMEHPNVVRVYSSGIHDGYPWLALEFVDGEDLGTLISRWNRSRPDDVYEQIEKILRGLCSGLQYTHANGLIHRDIKPSNILVSRDGEAKLTDFGVVKGDASSSHQTQLTMAGRLVGTVAFMAPELITAEDVDARADLYALGACLYMMLTGERPIEADSVAGYLARHLTEVPRPASERRPGVPHRLERIAMRLLRKDRGHRYPSGLAILQALDRPDSSEPLPLRGRDDLTTQWTRRLGALRDGAGGVVALVGPTGCGHTHLLHSLVDHARVSGTRAAWATAVEPDLLGQLARSLGLTDDQALNQELGRAPTVLAVDDADQMLPETRDSLAQLVRSTVALEAQRVLLVLTVRDVDGPLSTLVRGQATGIPADRLSVGPLARPAVVAMLRDRRFTGAVMAVLGRRLHDAYGGWPGPIVEQLEVMVEQDWFSRQGTTWKPAHPLEVYRRRELPVPGKTTEVLRNKLASLSPMARDVVALLATLDQPASAALLGRCVERRRELTRVLQELIGAGVVQREEAGEQDRYALSHPCMSRVVRSNLPQEQRRALHGRIAKALSARRRRASALELAYHQESGGDPAGAYPNYLQAARRAARSGLTADVLEIVAHADRVRAAAEASLDAPTAAGQRRWLRVLEGEARLERRDYEGARTALVAALEAAREETTSVAVARCLGGLGRTHHRLGQFAKAAPLLAESIELSETGSVERARACRALADINLRQGSLDEAERLFVEALSVAQRSGSRDGEARGRRGLGHVRALQGRLGEATELLAHAEEILAATGENPVRAAVLLRLIELDIASGRFGSALYRSEHLVELIRRQALSDRLARTYSLLGVALWSLGDAPEAYDAACQARIYIAASERSSISARLQLTRLFADLGHWDEAEEQLPAAQEMPQESLHDPAAQRAALAARCLARHDPGRAAERATWATGRPTAVFPVAAAWTCRDAAAALRAAGSPEAARKAAKLGLKHLQGTGADGTRLELLAELYRAAPDDRIIEAARPLLQRIRQGLHGTQRQLFGSRDDLAFLH